jgi:Ni,Fe-hydrogenase III large subunit/Ni,Fe-hydrogenase III component G
MTARLPETVVSGLAPHVAHLETAPSGELVCRCRPEALPEVARILTVDSDVRLQTVVGEDRRRDEGAFWMHYVLAHPPQGWLAQVSVRTDAARPAVPSLAGLHYPASRFEREARDLFGIVPIDHPDPRPLVRHGFWPADYHPLRTDAAPRSFTDDGRPFPFREVGGEGVYEIPVGPVHAGVIEPGHFRFSVVGETIIDMKARLYFTHKGTEKLFEGRAVSEGVELAERISGDTSVGHALAYCEAVEKAGGVEPPARAGFIRVVLLELERLYNHVADFGMIANDTGFAVAHSQCFRIREELLRLNKRLTGHRLLRGILTPGGVRADLPESARIAGELSRLLADFEEVVEISLRNTLLLDRLEGTGRVTLRTAKDHQVLGYVARASGIDVDARRDFPPAAYARLGVRVPVLETGDVHARTIVRVEEAREACRLIAAAVDRMPDGPLAADPSAWSFDPERTACAIVEGWRGALVHWVRVSGEGRLRRVKVVDPSFFNWPALSYALLRNIVPDFPLCNKSFNQSYSGNDL